MLATPGITPLNDANRLGIDYEAEAAQLPWTGVIWDSHVHIADLDAARVFFDIAARFNVRKVWSQSPLEDAAALKAEFGDRIELVATPDYAARGKPDTYTTDWHRRLEAFRALGSRLAKFWAAPRGRDFHESIHLEHPTRLEAMRVAHSLGMELMVHVADPDTWFATIYRDAHRYGTKASHYEPLERLLDAFPGVTWQAAHMAGDPERLDHLQDLLDRHPNLYLDTSATKWMVRELSKKPEDFRAFCRRNPGRVMFGSDIVVGPNPGGPRVTGPLERDLYASRYWALRVLFETDYDGPSPIVDPDLWLIDPSVSRTATPRLRGASFDPATLDMVYLGAVKSLRGV